MTAEGTRPRIEVRVDPGACMGAQRCVYLAPEVFRLGNDGVAEAFDPGAVTEERLVDAARQCPNSAIRVVRDGVVLVGEGEEAS